MDILKFPVQPKMYSELKRNSIVDLIFLWLVSSFPHAHGEEADVSPVGRVYTHGRRDVAYFGAIDARLAAARSLEVVMVTLDDRQLHRRRR